MTDCYRIAFRAIDRVLLVHRGQAQPPPLFTPSQLMAKTLQEIAELIRAVPDVISANIWEKHGKSRIYIELEKYNGGKNWNNGKAGTVWFENGKIHAKGDWAGAATRRAACRTIAEIEEALGSEVSSQYVPEKFSDRVTKADFRSDNAA